MQRHFDLDDLRRCVLNVYLTEGQQMDRGQTDTNDHMVFMSLFTVFTHTGIDSRSTLTADHGNLDVIRSISLFSFLTNGTT